MSDGARGGSNDPNLPLIATDDVGGSHYQRVKLDVGGDGATIPVVGQLPVSVASNVSVVPADSTALDAFGRLRVSNPATLFEGGFEYDLGALWFDSAVGSGGTVSFSSNTRSAYPTVPTTDGASSILQTRQFFPYERGKSQLIKATFVLGAAVAGVRRRVGYFETNNGVYLEQTSDGLRIVLRSSSSGTIENTEVEQADWNVDPLDGSGASQVTLNVARQQILVIDAQFLGSGRIRVGFNIGGETIIAHEFLNANSNATAPYMQTFSLPVRYEIANTAESAGGALQAICCEVETEGGVGSPNGYQFSAANTGDVNTSTSRAHVLSIRPATTYSGHVNRSVIVPLDFGVIAASQSIIVEVFHNSTLTGGAWAAADTFSGVEVGTGQTISAVGRPVTKFFVAAAAGPSGRSAGTGTISGNYPLTLDISGANPAVLTITATTLTSTGTCRAFINWKELR